MAARKPKTRKKTTQTSRSTRTAKPRAAAASAKRRGGGAGRKAKGPSPIPAGFRTITPHLVVEGAADAMEFYKRAFGAQELGRMPTPDGKKLMHAAMKFGDSMLMLMDAMEEYGAKGPKALGGSGFTTHLFVPDVDKAFRRALDAGCTVTMPLADMFWGDRYGSVKDPFGHSWSLATHIRDMTPEETEAAMKASFAAGKPAN